MNSFKKCREMSGYTQKQVALTLKISVQAVSFWETGERMPSYATLLRLADLYGSTTDELSGREVQRSENMLSEDEKRLIDNYRSLNQQGRELVKQTVYTFVASEIYKNRNDVSRVENA